MKAFLFKNSLDSQRWKFLRPEGLTAAGGPLYEIPIKVPALSLELVLSFLVSWIVSGVIIYIVLKIYPGKQRMETLWGALLAALVGELIYTFFYWIGVPLASLLALVVWLYAIRKMFGVGWIGAAVIAFLIYVFSAIVSLLGIPTLL